jgi:hypothetical protein
VTTIPIGLRQPRRRLCVRSPRSLLAAAALALAAACANAANDRPAPSTHDIVGWRQLGAWSGTSSLQTETFTSDTGSFRVHWHVAEASPPDSTLHVVFRSADSGNPIIDAVNQRGPGDGVATVSAERPRWYYLGIESARGAWTIRVEEPLFGERTNDVR